MRYRDNLFESLLNSDNPNKDIIIWMIREYYKMSEAENDSYVIDLVNYLINSKGYKTIDDISCDLYISESSIKKCIKRIDKAVLFILNNYNELILFIREYNFIELYTSI